MVDAPRITSDRIRRIALIHAAFTPSAPVSRSELFAGRQKQIERILGAVFSVGQHAVIYGERGVGKTSLSNIIYDLLVGAGQINFQPSRANCSQGITSGELWRSIFKQLPITRDGDTYHLDEQVPDSPNSEVIRELFQQLDNPSIIIVDEVDRSDENLAVHLADTIKTLSDHATDTTIILVGVADSINQLIEEHESILRALVQIQMPRMSPNELFEIIDNGMRKSDMTIQPEMRERIANLSQGLPHYTHLLSKHSALIAVEAGRTEINIDDLDHAIREATEDQSQTMANAYQQATHSPRKNITREVLLACALATNEFGVFSPVDVREPLGKIMREETNIQAYIKHLNKFCQESRGSILERKGQSRRFHYKFANPLMEPYIVLKGLADKLISDDQLKDLLHLSTFSRQLF